MRKLLRTLAPAAVVAVLISTFAIAGPGIGISLDSNSMTGTGSNGNSIGLRRNCGAAGQVLQWNGTTWGCATVGGGLSGGTTNQVMRWASSTTAGVGAMGDDGTASTAGNFKWTVITPTMGGGSFVDYTPTGLSTASLIRASTATSTCTLDTLTGGAAGRILFVQNVGTQSLVLLNQTTATGTAANKIITGTGASITVAVDQTVGLVYDGTTSRWRVFGFGNAGTVTSVASGTGLTGGPITSSGTLSLNIAGASCSAGNAMTSLNATGTGTCSAVGTVTSVASGTGLTGGPITSTGTLSLNIAGASCSTGQAMTSLGSTGTGSCSAVGPPTVVQSASFTGTQNDYAGINATTTIFRATGSTSPRINGITGGSDGRTLTITNVGTANITFSHQDAGSTAANRLLLTVGWGNTSDLIPDCSTTFIYDGTVSRWRQRTLSCYHLPGVVSDQILYADDTNGLAFGSAQAATYTGCINCVGYGNSTSQFRKLKVGDGKGNQIAIFDGTDLSTTFSGLVSIGAAHIAVGSGGQLQLANSNGAIATKASATVTVSSCGTTPGTPVGDRSAGHVTTGSGATSCTLTWGTGFTNANPTCVISTGSATKTFTPTINQGSLVIGSAQASSRYDWICFDHY